MPASRPPAPHTHGTSVFQPRATDLIQLGRPNRRWFLQAGLGGLAGLSTADLLRLQAKTGSGGDQNEKSVILFWLSGGPSHIDMWDPKPDATSQVRGPFGTIPTNVPGIRISDQLPRQAAVMDKISILRSVDCSASDHTPITMQAGHPLARRTNDGRDGGGYPSMGSIAAKFSGPINPAMPAFIALADSMAADVWGSGEMGSSYAPIQGTALAGMFKPPKGLTIGRMSQREELRTRMETFRRSLDSSGSMTNLDQYTRLAVEMVASGQAVQAFDIEKEDPRLRDSYGRTSLGQKALLARRMVEAGVRFVLVSGAWGYFDHHGDHVQWKGIEKGLKPLMPHVDSALATLITDLHQRGLLDKTLILMMGEFGRAPVINKEAGREHWTNVMSMLVAGGGLRHGQVIGSTDNKGHAILDRRITPQDIAATVFAHLGIDLESHWSGTTGRPVPILASGAAPIKELF